MRDLREWKESNYLEEDFDSFGLFVLFQVLGGMCMRQIRAVNNAKNSDYGCENYVQICCVFSSCVYFTLNGDLYYVIYALSWAAISSNV